MKKHFFRLIIGLIFLSIIFGFIIFLNQSYGFFILSKPYFNETYVSLRFDDGLKSQEHAFELLRKYNFTGSIYVITNKLSSEIDWEKSYYLGWEDINEISDFMEIGSHTMNHSDLTKDFDYGDEIKESKYALTERGFQAKSFAYPGGIYNMRILRSVEQNYQCAITQDIGTNRVPLRTHLLKSFTIRGHTSMDTVKRVIKKGKWNILVFHDINQIDNEEMPRFLENIANFNSVDDGFFEEILKYLKENNIKVITVAEGCEKWT